jgi:hypothetical protein
MADYREIEILFLTGGGEKPLVRAHYDGRQAKIPLRLPSGLVDPVAVLDRLAAHIAQPEPRAAFDPAEIGRQLFDALFAGDIGDLLASAKQGLNDGEVIRLRLQFDLDDDGSRRLASLPWELLHDRTIDSPILLTGEFSLIRGIDSVTRARTPRFNRPLRVLFAMSDPERILDLQVSAQ